MATSIWQIAITVVVVCLLWAEIERIQLNRQVGMIDLGDKHCLIARGGKGHNGGGDGADGIVCNDGSMAIGGGGGAGGFPK